MDINPISLLFGSLITINSGLAVWGIKLLWTVSIETAKNTTILASHALLDEQRFQMLSKQIDGK